MQKNEIYVRLHERVERHRMTPEEEQVLKTVSSRIKQHAFLGGLILGTATYFLGRSRSWRPLPLALTTGTGLIMGLQLGFATGAYSGYHSVKDLPSSQYLISLAKDVRMEFLAARGQVIDPGQCRPRSMTEQEKFEYQQSLQRQERRLNSDPEMGHSWDTHQSSQQDAKDQPGST